MPKVDQHGFIEDQLEAFGKAMAMKDRQRGRSPGRHRQVDISEFWSVMEREKKLDQSVKEPSEHKLPHTKNLIAVTHHISLPNKNPEFVRSQISDSHDLSITLSLLRKGRYTS